MALLEVRGLRCGYEGIPVVFGVDLDVEEGEVVTLLGANGAGKTTTLRAISGMVQVMSGSVNFAGSRITGRAPEKIARAGLLHVPAGRGVFPSLDVAETLRLAASLAGLSKADASVRLKEVYETFPRLAERAGQTAGTLSGGEQQMLALARALVSQPRLLMVDEMSQGLAPTIVVELFRVLARFTERGVAVLLVEQFVGQALAVAERAYVLEKGEISYAGSAAALAADEDFVRGSYLGQVESAAALPMAGAGVVSGVERAGAGAAAAAGGVALAEQVTVSLPPVLIRSLQERARVEGVSLAEVVRRVVEDGEMAAVGEKPAGDPPPVRRGRRAPAATRARGGRRDR